MRLTCSENGDVLFRRRNPLLGFLNTVDVMYEALDAFFGDLEDYFPDA